MPDSIAHSIHVDRVRKLVDVRVKGFFSPEDAGWVGEEVREAVRSLGADVGRHVTLYDVSGMKVAPAETVETIKESLANAAVRAIWARKVAFVTPSTLLRRQIIRLRAVREDIGVFEDRETALAWLLAE